MDAYGNKLKPLPGSHLAPDEEQVPFAGHCDDKGRCYLDYTLTPRRYPYAVTLAPAEFVDEHGRPRDVGDAVYAVKSMVVDVREDAGGYLTRIQAEIQAYDRAQKGHHHGDVMKQTAYKRSMQAHALLQFKLK